MKQRGWRCSALLLVAGAVAVAWLLYASLFFLQSPTNLRDGHPAGSRQRSRSFLGRSRDDHGDVGGCDVFYLIFSAVGNSKERTAVRQTWLQLSGDGAACARFVVGAAGLDKPQHTTLVAEHSLYSDLLLLPSVRDDYAHLTEKLLGAFTWLSHAQGFQSLDFVVKVDDDSFVLPNELEQYMYSINTAGYIGLYLGYFDGRAPVQKHGKWAEPSWHLCDRYLPYALGGGYVLSASIIEFLAKNAPLFKAYNSEDVSVGAWTASLNVLRVHSTRFDTEWKTRGCQNSHLVAHKQSPADFYSRHSVLEATGGKEMCRVEQVLRSSYEYDWDVPPSQCCHHQ